MKVMIVGAGVIGTISGWALSNAGNDVIHFVRPGRSSKYKEGILMDVLDKRKGHNPKYIGKYMPKLTESLSRSDRFDLVIVPIKHYQLEETLKQIAPMLKEMDYLLTPSENQNGLFTSYPELERIKGNRWNIISNKVFIWGYKGRWWF